MVDVVIEGLRTAALGMGVVFLSLGALYCVLRQFERIAARTGESSRERDQVRSLGERASPDANELDGNPEIAAVIACVMSLEGGSGGRIKVRSAAGSNHQRSAVLEEGIDA